MTGYEYYDFISDRLCQRKAMQTLYDKKVKCDCKNPCKYVSMQTNAFFVQLMYCFLIKDAHCKLLFY
jgi:hypothetical protein